MIPKGWNLVLLEDIADVIDPHPSHRAPSIVKDGVPFVGIGDIDVQGNIDLTSVRKVSQDTAIEHEKNYSIIDGDLAFGRVASIGKVIRLKRFEFKYAISPTLAIIKPKKEYKNILPFLLQADITQNQFEKIKSGSTRSSVGMLTLRKLELLMPTEKERNTISEILSTCDEAIEKLSNLIVSKEKQKKGLVQNLLTGKVRFNKFNKVQWIKIPLGKAAEIIMGQSPDSNSYNSEEGIFLIQGNADIKERVSVPRILTTQPTKYCNIGDILMTVRAPVGAIAKSKHKACIGRGICSIRPTSVDAEYLYQYLIFKEDGWKALEQGSTFTAVSSSDIKSLEINIPNDQNNQKQIGELLYVLDFEIKNLKSQLINLKNQKKGLMQQLLTGKIRVK